MDNREHFGALLDEVQGALEESMVRQRTATQQGNLEAMEAELDRQKNLVSARQQIEGLRELWPKLVGSRKPALSEGRKASQTHQLRLEFWMQLLAKANKRTHLHAGVSPKTDHWLSAGAGMGSLTFSYIILIKEAQVELYLNRRPVEENKRLFDQLAGRRKQIEAAFGASLDWLRLNNKLASRIRYVIPGGGLADRDRWPEIQEKLIDAMVRLEKALTPEIKQLKR